MGKIGGLIGHDLALDGGRGLSAAKSDQTEKECDSFHSVLQFGNLKWRDWASGSEIANEGSSSPAAHPSRRLLGFSVATARAEIQLIIRIRPRWIYYNYETEVRHNRVDSNNKADFHSSKVAIPTGSHD